MSRRGLLRRAALLALSMPVSIGLLTGLAREASAAPAGQAATATPPPADPSESIAAPALAETPVPTATTPPTSTATTMPAPLPPPPTPPAGVTRETVLTSLRLSHPRLMLLAEDEARVRRALTSDVSAHSFRDALLRNGSRVITQPTPERALIGSRLLTVSRTVLDRVTTLALLYRLDADRRWALRARDELLAAAAFADWNPAHFLDVAEMSHAFAIGYDWLFDALSPDDRATIHRALVDKGLQPALQEYTARAPWTRATHSWNLVCNGATAIGALAIADEEPGLAGTLLAQALASLPLAVAAYAPDGGWPEGPSAWEYGTLYLVSVLAALTSALGTDFGLGESAGLATTGRFRLHVTGPTGLFFNYADAIQRAGDAPMLFWLARRYDDPTLAVAAREAATGRSSARDLLWYDGRGTAADVAALPLDARFQGTRLACFRSAWNDKDALYVGFKGGDNAAPGAQLDLGTFVLDALGQRWAVDLGPDDVDLPGYAGPERWTYERLKTSGQNTLLLDGANQDPKASAPLTAYRSGPDGGFAIADLTAAYAGGGATRVNRGVTLRDGRSRVLVQDEVETSRAVELTWTMHTQAAVELQGNRALLSQGGAVLEARLLAPAGATFALEDVQIEPPQQPAPDLQRLLVRVPDVTSVQLAILFTPRRGLTTEGVIPAAPVPGSSPSATPAESLPLPEIVDLSRWASLESPLADRPAT